MGGEEEGKKKSAAKKCMSPKEPILWRWGGSLPCAHRMNLELHSQAVKAGRVVSTTVCRFQTAPGLLCIFRYPEFSAGWI